MNEKWIGSKTFWLNQSFFFSAFNVNLVVAADVDLVVAFVVVCKPNFCETQLS